jgi:2-keto-4-pentenoate hydratase
MRIIALLIACVAGLIVPGFTQQAEIEAVNTKWIDFFNKGDFAGVATLYTEDATAFPPGSPMVKGRAAIEVPMVKYGRPLQPGDVILSGALGPMVAVSPGDTFEAQFEGLGHVRTSFGSSCLTLATSTMRFGAINVHVVWCGH